MTPGGGIRGSTFFILHFAMACEVSFESTYQEQSNGVVLVHLRRGWEAWSKIILSLGALDLACGISVDNFEFKF